MNRREALKAFASIPAGVAAVALAPRPTAAAVAASAALVPTSTGHTEPAAWWHGVEEFRGTGLTRTFTLRNKVENHYGYVVNDAVYETLATAGFGGAAWTYDPKDNTVTRDWPPAHGAVIRVMFDAWEEEGEGRR